MGLGSKLKKHFKKAFKIITKPLKSVGKAVGVYKSSGGGGGGIAEADVAEAPDLDLLKPEDENVEEEQLNEKVRKRRGKRALKVDVAEGTGLAVGSSGTGRNVV